MNYLEEAQKWWDRLNNDSKLIIFQINTKPSIINNGWKCASSPTGFCNYLQDDGDIDEDCCRYCGMPEERK